ncbi:unnamed protein product [Prorocentrum cordatum]|uniref:Uncharacterized protein n=1 Tax=Prorocentrum cordatum TaxID=2364126 RepID=A0ABN9U264_9DINO|nr:unnamed protein product [Polarella glacialis]
MKPSVRIEINDADSWARSFGHPSSLNALNQAPITRPQSVMPPAVCVDRIGTLLNLLENGIIGGYSPSVTQLPLTTNFLAKLGLQDWKPVMLEAWVSERTWRLKL